MAADMRMVGSETSMKRLLARCGAVLLALWLAQNASSFAQQDKWLELGTGQASKVSSSAYLHSDTTKGTVCSLRFQVEGSGIEIDEITVHFGNSQTFHALSQMKLAPNTPLSASPTLALPGVRRSVRGVDIVYKLADAGAVAPMINVWGNRLPGQIYCPK